VGPEGRAAAATGPHDDAMNARVEGVCGSFFGTPSVLRGWGNRTAQVDPWHGRLTKVRRGTGVARKKKSPNWFFRVEII
jgi:hypothetical protein